MTKKRECYSTCSVSFSSVCTVEVDHTCSTYLHITAERVIEVRQVKHRLSSQVLRVADIQVGVDRIFTS